MLYILKIKFKKIGIANKSNVSTYIQVIFAYIK